MANRIDQNGERLYTVRPRSTPIKSEQPATVASTRGTVSTIRFHVPRDLQENTAAYATDQPEYIQHAFSRAVSDNGFINFIAQSVSYSIQEKSQIMHTFGSGEAVYFYGRAPIMVNISGLIIDDLDNDQFAQFLGLYKEFLRGTKSSQDYCYVELTTNNATFTGTFLNIQIQQTSDRDTDIQFSAQFLAKTFTLASTDEIFMGNNDINQGVKNVRVSDELTLSQMEITRLLFLNNLSSLAESISPGMTAESYGLLRQEIDRSLEGSTTIPAGASPNSEVALKLQAVMNTASNDPSGLATALKNLSDEVAGFVPGLLNSPNLLPDFLKDFKNPLTSLPTLSLGDYTRSFGTLPSLEDVIGFSAADITDFFGDVNDLISNVTKPVQDLANQISGFASDALGLLESVERGIDSIIGNINSATAAVYGAIDDVQDAISTILNFPDALSSKLGSFSLSGQVRALTLRIAGSENIPSGDAVPLLAIRSSVGAARGTPQGSSAKLSITRRNNRTTSLLPTGGSTNEDVPTLIIGPIPIGG